MAKTPKIIVQKATAFQLNPKHSYMIHVPSIEPEEVDALQAWLKEQGIEKAIIVSTEQLNITEVPELPTTVK